MRFFTADTHFGHANIINLCNRPFADVAEMNAAMVAGWNATVRRSDDVFVLGDFLLGPFADGMDWLHGRLHGNLHLIAGNHDRVWGGNRKVSPANAWEAYLRIFDTVQDEAVIWTEAGPVMLSHFPFTGDSHGEDRYADRRPVDRGIPLLHGHVHDAFLRGVSDKGTPHLNVGVDRWSFLPVAESVALHTLLG